MRVAVFRAVEDGLRTAARLADLGHEAVLAPVIRIVATGAPVKAGVTDELIFTSAHAPLALAEHLGTSAALRDLPCWCVGTRTAAAARSAGFARLTATGGTAADLAQAIAARATSGSLILVAGRDRKPDLEEALAQAGCRLTVVEAYEAQPIGCWPPETIAQFGGVAAALHYSRRSASLAYKQAEMAGLAEDFRNWTHCCLSQDVAGGLNLGAAGQIRLARRPDEIALLALLGSQA